MQQPCRSFETNIAGAYEVNNLHATLYFLHGVSHQPSFLLARQPRIFSTTYNAKKELQFEKHPAHTQWLIHNGQTRPAGPPLKPASWFDPRRSFSCLPPTRDLQIFQRIRSLHESMLLHHEAIHQDICPARVKIGGRRHPI
jgi:hypothetical protein